MPPTGVVTRGVPSFSPDPSWLHRWSDTTGPCGPLVVGQADRSIRVEDLLVGRPPSVNTVHPFGRECSSDVGRPPSVGPIRFRRIHWRDSVLNCRDWPRAIGQLGHSLSSQVAVTKPLKIVITGLMMQAEAEPKPRRRRNESSCGVPVARFGVCVGPFHGDCNLHRATWVYGQSLRCKDRRYRTRTPRTGAPWKADFGRWRRTIRRTRSART
jgi:hypothetical protein